MLLSAVRAIAMACLLAVSTAGASSESPSTGASITLQSAVERALASHPQLAGFAFELQIQDAHAAQAVQRPMPMAELLLEDAAGTGDRSGLSGAQTTLSLSQVLELGGKREGRSEVAQATRARLRTEQAARQLDLVAEVARRFVQTLAAQSRIAAAQGSVLIAQGTTAAVTERVRAAAAPEVEQLRVAVALTEARLELEDAEHDLDTARHWLAAAMGIAAPDFGRADGELLALPPAESFGSLIARLQATPDFLRFADEARLRDAEVRLAQRQRRSDLHASVGLRRYEAGDDLALVAGLSLPLFAASYARPQIDAAHAARERVGSERDAAFLRAQAQLYAQYQELEHARHVTVTLQNEVLPVLETALEQSEYAYRRGRYSYLEWSDAQRRLLESRRRLIDTAADFHTYRIEIERLTGESLAPAGEQP